MPQHDDWNLLQKRLSHLGYLAPEHVRPVTKDGPVSPELKRAIGSVQKAAGEKVERDPRIGDIHQLGGISTLLDQLFCGVPDAGGSIGPLTFGSPGGRWTRGNLRFSINPAGCNLVGGGNPVAIIAGAFAQWQAASSFFSLTLAPVGSGENIRAVFGGTSVDPRFGAAGGVLASAGYPQAGNLQFDSKETWSATGTVPNTSNLLAVALHEIGHLLGLSHSNAPSGTMYPFAASGLTIDAESQRAINAMYGWQPQRRLADRGTSDRASLGRTSTANFTSRSETAHMVWKGVGDDHGIWESEFTGSDWTPQRPIPSIGSTNSPSLAEIGVPAAVPTTGLIMAWRGVPDDQGLYWMRNSGSGWEQPQQRIAGVGSSTRPALGNAAGIVCMAWKGVSDDQGIYWSRFDGTSNWTPQARIDGVGTSDSPALVGIGNVLHMFWKGVDGDANAYHSSFDFQNDPIWKPQRRIEYFSYQSTGGVPLAIGTTGGLSAALRGNRILLAWKGVQGDSGIYISLLENNEFSGQIRVPNVGTSMGPSLVDANGQTLMAWKGIQDDSNIYWSMLP